MAHNLKPLLCMRTSTVSEQALHFGRSNLGGNSSVEFPTYLTLKEVAELLKGKPRTVYAWVSDRRIPFGRKGGLLRFRLDAVTAWNEPER
jgi:excisionase family DNA binding protein